MKPGGSLHLFEAFSRPQSPVNQPSPPFYAEAPNPSFLIYTEHTSAMGFMFSVSQAKTSSRGTSPKGRRKRKFRVPLISVPSFSSPFTARRNGPRPNHVKAAPNKRAKGKFVDLRVGVDVGDVYFSANGNRSSETIQVVQLCMR
uniref:Uncharacterized protein n=1 Tax=Coccidioides posadasii RMSCC 3488 TaxID=454284 RepID=A0A0J6HZ45_COCPO|nr:hypothetical protein CPAG_00604 [Coccidioides posadasii RMSCC 3488]